MSARDLTLTSIGLPVRAELRLRSLLEVVNARTIDRWSFVERADAHVAICDPASALSSVTMKRSASGATRFFSLVQDATLAAAGTSVIRDPIRACDLIELLNLVSSTLSCENLTVTAQAHGCGRRRSRRAPGEKSRLFLPGATARVAGECSCNTCIPDIRVGQR